MGVVIVLLSLLVIMLAVALGFTIKLYRQLRYICLCDGMDVTFKESKNGALICSVPDTAYVSVSSLYNYLVSPLRAKERLLRSVSDPAVDTSFNINSEISDKLDDRL